mmetsp:Transcript_31293/g.78426  ORF Transcript_31293/g.78426 Transcript_31293/m.78426 type:complete len:306 (-) Transcript_31293:28-945(-)|eukprot:CAMPEP_0181359638 /NCGR_PEP_ID=MMETSP1106-20121128/6203_1 /TAXON_ID=81844 /ORGANISM="Mantoniella antarctica, Strain SL-175" /LENGTH=305 /DNA_ID=CAMNT_0023472785 /DNA_START=231 /DNA_END=1148 /DNA_ORIENTATION=+
MYKASVHHQHPLALATSQPKGVPRGKASTGLRPRRRHCPSVLLCAKAHPSDEFPAVQGDWRSFRAELVSKEHAHRGLLQNPSYTVPSSAQVPSTRNVPGDWAHRLPEAEQGCLLLAPENEGGWWQHSVVLVLSHDHEGSSGVILNRPTNSTMRRVVPEVKYSEYHRRALASRQVSMGGPMGCDLDARCLVALSKCKLDVATREVFPGLWQVDDFDAVMPEHEASLVMFVGYCGWVHGQLDAEVANNRWTVAAASATNTMALVNSAAWTGDLMGEAIWAAMRERLERSEPRDARWGGGEQDEGPKL